MSSHTKPRRRWPWIVGAFIAAPVITVIALGATASPTPAPTAAPAAVGTVPTLPPPIVVPTEPAPRTQVLQAPGLPPVTHELPANQWAAGTYEVGNGDGQIPAGKYHTDAKGAYGYWARLSGTDGENQSIIANGMSMGPTTITVKPTDAAVAFSGDYIWTRVASSS